MSTRASKTKRQRAQRPRRIDRGAAAGPLQQWGCWLTMGVALLVYVNTLPNDFAYDDMPAIQNNPRLRNTSRWAEIWTRDYWATARSGEGRDRLYRPITLQSWALNYLLGDQPWHFHAVNVVLYAAVCAGVWLLARGFFDDPLAATLAGLLFAVHPLHTEAVANIVGRGELLCACFMLLALLAWRRDGQPTVPGRRPPGRGPWLVLVGAAAAGAAMLAKENGLSLIPIALLLDWWWSRREAGNRGRFWRLRLLRCYVPLAVVTIGYLAARAAACGVLITQGRPERFSNPLVAADTLVRVLTPFKLLASYLRLFVLPDNLCADYSLATPLLADSLADPAALAGIAVVIAAVVSVVWSRRRKQEWLVLVLFVVFAYAMAANAVILIGTIMGERLFFWPSVPLCLALGRWGARAWALRRSGQPDQPAINRNVCLLVAAVLLLGLGLRTVLRNRDWADNETIAASAYQANPHSGRVLYGYGATLRNEGHIVKAIEVLEHAVHIYAWNHNWWVPLGFAYAQNGRLDRGIQALQIARTILGLRPSPYVNLVYYRLMMEAQARRGVHTRPSESGLPPELLPLLMQSRFPEALPKLEAAFRRSPHDESLVLEVARADVALGRPARAAELLRNFVDQHPQAAHSAMALARLLLAGPDRQSAVRFADQAFKRAGDDPLIHIQYAEVLGATGQRQQALAEYETILNKHPEKWVQDIAGSRIADLRARP